MGLLSRQGNPHSRNTLLFISVGIKLYIPNVHRVSFIFCNNKTKHNLRRIVQIVLLFVIMCQKCFLLMPDSSVFFPVCFRLLDSWVCCGVSASSPVSTQSTSTSPCRSTRSSFMASWCSSSSTPSRPATTNHVSGFSSCWSVHSFIYWSISFIPPPLYFERITTMTFELWWCFTRRM